MSKNPVVHFKVPYKNAKRVAEFYTKAFGWQMKELGSDMGGYVTVGTAETDENRMVKTHGTINGGFYDSGMPQASPIPSVVISVADVQKAMSDAQAADGQILSEPQEIPGIGL